MASERNRAKYQEGPEAARRAEQAVTRLLTVSKEELARREAAYQKSRRAKRRRPIAPLCKRDPAT